MVNEVISLPMHSELDENQIDYISSSIKSFLKINEMRISIVFIFGSFLLMLNKHIFNVVKF